MDSKKKTNQNSTGNGTRKKGTPKCHTFPPSDPSRRKKPIWTAKAILPASFDHHKKKIYLFSYEPLEEFDSINAYREDLEQSFKEFGSFFAFLKDSSDVKLIQVERENLCGTCSVEPVCDHKESFSCIYEIHYSLKIKTCPNCGSPLQPWYEATPSPAIRDVRLMGYPTHLYFDETNSRWCPFCEKNISGIRVPSVQEKKRGKITLRLIRSLFELSLSNVPNEYVAEGYALTTTYVGEKSREFKTKTAKEYAERIIELFSGKTRADFYDEPVYLNGKLFRAVFTADKKEFLTILPEDELNAIYEVLSGDTENVAVRTANAFNRVTPYILTTSHVAGREVIASALNLAYAFSLDLEEDYKKGFQKRNNAPEWDSEQEWQFQSGYKGFYLNMISFARDAFYSRSVNLEVFDWSLREYSERVPSTYKRTLKQLKALRATIRKAQANPHRWEDRFNEDEPHIYEWKPYRPEDIENMPRLEISKLMEACSKESEFSLSEQLARIQYYNELSVFPLSSEAQKDFPVLNEKGWPSYENTMLGKGIPVKCLTHMLRNGLLDKDAPAPSCIRQRLGLIEHEYSGNCTIENCPFLG